MSKSITEFTLNPKLVIHRAQSWQGQSVQLLKTEEKQEMAKGNV